MPSQSMSASAPSCTPSEAGILLTAVKSMRYLENDGDAGLATAGGGFGGFIFVPGGKGGGGGGAGGGGRDGGSGDITIGGEIGIGATGGGCTSE